MKAQQIDDKNHFERSNGLQAEFASSARVLRQLAKLGGGAEDSLVMALAAVGVSHR